MRHAEVLEAKGLDGVTTQQYVLLPSVDRNLVSCCPPVLTPPGDWTVWIERRPPTPAVGSPVAELPPNMVTVAPDRLPTLVAAAVWLRGNGLGQPAESRRHSRTAKHPRVGTARLIRDVGNPRRQRGKSHSRRPHSPWSGSCVGSPPGRHTPNGSHLNRGSSGVPRGPLSTHSPHSAAGCRPAIAFEALWTQTVQASPSNRERRGLGRAGRGPVEAGKPLAERTPRGQAPPPGSVANSASLRALVHESRDPAPGARDPNRPIELTAGRPRRSPPVPWPSMAETVSGRQREGGPT